MNPLKKDKKQNSDQTVETMDDNVLLTLISSGDREAFSELYRSYQPRLLHYCSRVLKGDVALAADIVDDALFDVWRSASKFEGKSKPSTWIHSIAHNKLVSYLRKNSDSRLDKNLLQISMEQTVPTPDEHLQGEDLNAQLVRHMGSLSAEHREILELAYFRELPVKSIASMLKISENTVKTRMFHARKRMKHILTRAGIMRDKNG